MKTNTRQIFLMTLAVLLTASPMLHASETDDRIESAFKDSYVAKTYLQTDSVKASSKDGVVSLTGTVDQQSHKKLAEETASNLPGVSRVDNLLEVKTGSPEEKSDGWIGMNVKAALLFHRNVSGLNTQVEVENGVVTLRGNAESQAQKDLTAEYASDIDGVSGVHNEMTVVENQEPKESFKEKIDDASITAQAKIALATHRSTSALKTSVSTDAGVVTVKGNAKNDAEKALVTKLVSDIHGVDSVVNNMTVA